MKRTVSVFVCAGLFSFASAQVSLERASGSLESAYAEWILDVSDNYNVYYSRAGDVRADAPLIRKYGSKFRVDVVASGRDETPERVSSSSSTPIENLSSENEQGVAVYVPSKENLFYDSKSDRLVIGTNNVVRLDIVGIDGRRFDGPALEKVGDIRMLDLSALRAGIYVVRLSTWMSTKTMKFVKQ